MRNIITAVALTVAATASSADVVGTDTLTTLYSNVPNVSATITTETQAALDALWATGWETSTSHSIATQASLVLDGTTLSFVSPGRTEITTEGFEVDSAGFATALNALRERIDIDFYGQSSGIGGIQAYSENNSGLVGTRINDHVRALSVINSDVAGFNFSQSASAWTNIDTKVSELTAELALSQEAIDSVVSLKEAVEAFTVADFQAVATSDPAGN